MNIGAPSRQPKRPAWTREELIRRRAVALGASLEASTRSTYQSGVNSYLSFCRSHHLPIDPTPSTLSFFVVYTSHYISPRSVQNYLIGITRILEPFYPNVREARQSRLVKNTLAGCLKLRSKPTSRKSPLLAHHLRSLPSPTSYNDFLFTAIVFCGHYGLHRLGELVQSDNPAHRYHRKLIKRFSLHHAPIGISYLLPYHKADRYFLGNTVVLPRRDDDLDPVRRLDEYLKRRDTRFPLRCELFLRRDGTVPTRSWFLRRLRKVFDKENFGGHSLRAGGATELALAGTPDVLIRRMGRWAGDAWERYIRVHPVLLAALLQEHH